MTWARVTRQNPCGICEKPDWCTVGEKGWCCMRVESNHPIKNGGWFHPFDGNHVHIELEKPKPLPLPPSINATKLISDWQNQTKPESICNYAGDLSVSHESLICMSVAYAAPHRAWAFPMRDGYGNVVGIRLRSDDGRKWAVRGSKQGIFIPNIAPQPVVYLAEGPTSTAAAVTLGLFALGRPSCSSGGSEIKTALNRLGVQRAVIVADNDERWNDEIQRWLKPGLDGAIRLAKEIGIRSVIWTPPTKDLRDFLKAGGTKQLIESELKNFVWKKP